MDWDSDGLFCPVCEEDLLEQQRVTLNGLRVCRGTDEYSEELTCKKCGATVSFDIRITMEFKVTEYETLDGDE